MEIPTVNIHVFRIATCFPSIAALGALWLPSLTQEPSVGVLDRTLEEGEASTGSPGKSCWEPDTEGCTRLLHPAPARKTLSQKITSEV